MRDMPGTGGYMLHHCRQNSQHSALNCHQHKGGGFIPDLLTRGFAPGPHWGLYSQVPAAGSCFTLPMWHRSSTDS